MPNVGIARRHHLRGRAGGADFLAIKLLGLSPSTSMSVVTAAVGLAIVAMVQKNYLRRKGRPTESAEASPTVSTVQPAPSDDERIGSCPNCGKPVRASAPTCPHCRADFGPLSKYRVQLHNNDA